MTRRMCLVLVHLAIALIAPSVVSAAEPSGAEIVRQCDYKNAGADQASILTIVLVDKDGNERKNVYKRLWKKYDGKDGLVEKMVLITQFPPDAKGTGFLRWGYSARSKKAADQWLYLPQLRKVRRVSIRDPGDSFLGSDLTYGDIDERLVEADNHKLLRTDNVRGYELYVVESTPREKDPQYSKRVSWYTKHENMDECVRVRTEYYDKMGALLKTSNLKWQSKDGNWSWDRVLVHNVQTGHRSDFQITNVEYNVGLKDQMFTERALRKVH